MSGLLILIVNYRTPAMTVDCLASLTAPEGMPPGSRVMVVDADSQDGSFERITSAIERNGWQDQIACKSLHRNGGFAYANNAAFELATGASSGSNLPKYILLLNPDTLVRPHSVGRLVRFIETHPAVGIVGSRLEDPDGTPQRSAFRFPSSLGEFESAVRLGVISRMLKRAIVAPPVPNEECRTDWVAGASMLIRTTLLQQIAFLDEGFFMYFEEVDFCRRAKQAGWETWYVPESHVVHFVGQASGVTNVKGPLNRRPTYWFDSRRRYFQKHHGFFYACLADFMWIVGFSLWRARRLVQQMPDRDPPHFLGDFVRNAFRFQQVR